MSGFARYAPVMLAKRFLGVALVLSAFSTNAVAANWVNVQGSVRAIGTGWQPDTACVYLSTNDVAKLDLTTETGRAQLSIALTAHASGRRLQVYFDQNGTPDGGCNTGTSILPHGRLIRVTD